MSATPGQRTIRIGLIIAADARTRIELRPLGVAADVRLDDRPAGRLDDRDTLVAGLDQGAVRVAGDRIVGRAARVRIEPPPPAALEPRRGLELRDVPAGRGFHWHKTVHATYPGAIEILPAARGLVVVNDVPLEAYLAGVITAEMGPECPAALLETQAIVARSWLIAMREPKHTDEPFDRCNDDCCQRYQGTTHLSAAAKHAIDATRGRVLRAADGSVLDANYAKSCGGITESPQAVWGQHKLGLVPVVDAPPDAPEHERFAPRLADRNGPTSADANRAGPAPASHESLPCPDARNLRRVASAPCTRREPESFIEEYLTGSWLRGTHIWCSPRCVPVETIGRYLGRVDQPDDYFRWQTTVARETVEQLLREHLAECRELAELRSVQITRRGVSGRAIEALVQWLDPQGRDRRTALKSEYRIRQVLHPRFLYSSAILIEARHEAAGRLASLHIRGAGWGHGVGMCQIGALGMALAGCSAEQICRHYYPLATLGPLL